MGTRGWKDTINVPQLQTVRFAVKFDAPGRWMYHCHILEHAERGMMGEHEGAP
jgi:FtsP/CotA-like multicopper oxidase with cupredoxin domain